MMRLISFIFISLLSYEVMAQDIPDFSANYLVKMNGLQAGELKRSLSTQENGLRKFKSSSQAKGVFAFFKPDLVEESSIFKWQNNQVIPQSYLYQRTGGKKEKYLKLDFNWTNNHVDIDDRKHPWTLHVKPNTLDKLVYQIMLMADLADNKITLNYQIADGGKTKHYIIKILGEEVISTPLGKIKTIKLTRQRKDSKGRNTTLWCAPELHYLPVKLEHTEKGGTFTALLRRLKGIDNQPFEKIKSKQPATPAFGTH